MWNNFEKFNFFAALNYAALSIAAGLTLTLLLGALVALFFGLDGGVGLTTYLITGGFSFWAWLSIEGSKNISSDIKQSLYSVIGIFLPVLLMRVETPGRQSFVDAFGLAIPLIALATALLLACLNEIFKKKSVEA